RRQQCDQDQVRAFGPWDEGLVDGPPARGGAFAHRAWLWRRLLFAGLRFAAVLLDLGGLSGKRDLGARSPFDRIGTATRALAGRVRPRHQASTYCSSILSTAMNASCGISTLPTRFMRRFPSRCFSSSLRFRVMSP